MTRFMISLLALLLLSGPALAAEDAPSQPIEPVLQRMLTDYIRPGYAGFDETATTLQDAMAELCSVPSQAHLDAARTAFSAVVNKWARIEWLRLGPVMAEDRLERILFFPDRKGTGRKQVQAALAAKSDEVTDPDVLAGKSVAMQGLGALEFILFGTGSDELVQAAAGHRCGFGSAAATNLADRAGEIVAGWADDGAYVPLFLKPGQGNPFFRTGREALSVLLGQMIHGLEAIRDTRIGAFLDRDEPDRARPKLALFWRSQLTLPTVGAGISGLEALFNNSGIEIVTQELAPRLGDTIRFEFTQAIRTADSLNAPVEELVADPQSRRKLVYLDYAIKIIIDRLDKDFAQAGGLAVGFSFGDGD